MWLIGVAVAALVLLAAIPVIYFASTAGTSTNESADTAAPPRAPSQMTASEPPDAGASDGQQSAASNFRVVNLPESTRKKIYQEFQRMEASMGKAQRLPDGEAGKAFRSMLGKTADREVTRMALAYNISEADIQEILKEGQAKDW